MVNVLKFQTLVDFLPGYPAFFTHNFVSGMQSFYFGEFLGFNGIADLS